MFIQLWYWVLGDVRFGQIRLLQLQRLRVLHTLSVSYGEHRQLALIDRAFARSKHS